MVHMASATRRNLKSDDWFGLRRNSGASEFSDYTFDALHLPVAGMRSDKVNHDPRDFDPRNDRGGKKCKPEKKDLSLLKMNEDRYCPDKHTLGFKSRVDPAVKMAAAGSTSEKFTYAPGKEAKMEWDRREEKVRKEQDRKPNGVNVLHGPKGYGDTHPDPRTDPITHFKSEGRVFKAADHSSKRCGYDSRATKMTFELSHKTKPKTFETIEGNDQEAIEERHQRYKKNLLDAVGRMHYWQGGEEDMIPAATKDSIKCERKPTDKHVHENDRTQLLWCERVDRTPRRHHKGQSDQMSACLNYEPRRRPVEAGTQCSVVDSESVSSSPRRVLARVRSAPSSLREDALRLPGRDSVATQDIDPLDYLYADSENRKARSGQYGRSPRTKTPPKESKSRVRMPQDSSRISRTSSTPRMTPRGSATPPRPNTDRQGISSIPRTLLTPESNTFELRRSEVSDTSSCMSVALRAALLSARPRQ